MIIWAANVCIVVSLVLLGYRWFRSGWALTVAGNLVYFASNVFVLHRLDYAFMSAVVATVSCYNMVREIWKFKQKTGQPN